MQMLGDVFGESLDWNHVSRKGWTALDEAESRDFQDVEELGYLALAKFRKRTMETVAYLSGKGVERRRGKEDFGRLC